MAIFRAKQSMKIMQMILRMTFTKSDSKTDNSNHFNLCKLTDKFQIPQSFVLFILSCSQS